jgi:hypothetical protein
MTKLNPKQALNLAIVSAADQRWRDGVKSLEADVRREMEGRSSSLLQARSDAVLIAYESGVPKSQLSVQGLRTSHVQAARDAIEDATLRRAARAPEVALSWDGKSSDNSVSVRLSGATLDAACGPTGWSTSEAIAAGADVAVFHIEGDSQSSPVAVTDSFLAEYELPHPVVSWGRANADELVRLRKEMGA